MAEFKDILDRYQVPHRQAGEHRHATAGWMNLDCPYCGPNSGKFHLGYSLKKKYLTCWRCGYHPLFETLVLLTQAPRQVCYQLLQEIAPQRLQPPTGASNLKGGLVLPQGLEPLAKAHKRYLRGRGLDPEELTRVWGVQGLSITPRLSWRLFIPIKKSGKTVSWTTRSLSDDSERRYVTAKPEEEILPSKSILFGADLARQAIIICEGPLDAMRIGPGSCATLGVNYSKSQLSTMAKFPKRIVCFDSEILAQKRAQKLCLELSSLPGETINIEIDAKDPGCASEQELRELRKLLR